MVLPNIEQAKPALAELDQLRNKIESLYDKIVRIRLKEMKNLIPETRKKAIEILNKLLDDEEMELNIAITTAFIFEG